MEIELLRQLKEEFSTAELQQAQLTALINNFGNLEKDCTQRKKEKAGDSVWKYHHTRFCFNFASSIFL